MKNQSDYRWMLCKCIDNIFYRYS